MGRFNTTMTKEEQELLYKELSARQFYGVRLESNSEEGPELLTGIEGLPTDNWVTFYTDMNVINVNFALGTRQQVPRPYLRSLSTMTNEEYDEMQNEIAKCNLEPWGDICIPNSNLMLTVLRQCYYLTSFFDRKSFDWRVNDEGKTLIELGLAIEMPKEMYNQKPERK